MAVAETKKIAFCACLLLLAIFVMPNLSGATDYTSGSFTVKDPVIDTGTQTSSSLNFGLGQSVSQLAIGQSTSASFQLWSGFQYYYRVVSNVLNATPDNGEVDLSWTVPSTFLGVNVAGYEVGTGTTSGSYTFENVGNVTSFTKTGLSNGTLYYFVVKAYASGGTFLVFSNEASATPNGAAPPGGGGGGGGGSGGNVVIDGYAYPNSPVTVLRDSFSVATANADSSGRFSFNLTNLSSGNYSFGVYATDANGLRSPTVGFERTISSNVTTSVSNVIVAPTVVANYSVVKQGDSITVSGYTGPNSPVSLFFSLTQSFSRTSTSDAAGRYSVVLDTAPLAKGEYDVYASSIVNGVSSPISNTIRFRVGDSTVTPPPPGECSKRSDLNCDSRVDLVDFSILLYFWEASDFSRNPRVDIDRSGEVGLRDLSIMLYDWTG